MRPHSCPKCQGAMAEGFVTDKTYGAIGVGEWVEGAPVKSIWQGLKLRGKTKYNVQTWRCSRCGFLESYAPSSP